eukprot:gene6332-6566_t
MVTALMYHLTGMPQVEFDDVPQLSGAPFQRRRDWWRQTKQLQHGSLVALWWDGNDDDSNTSVSNSSNRSGGEGDGGDGGSGGGGGAVAADAVRALPNLLFATVCDRQDQLLASPGEPRKRPQVGIKMCGTSVTSELLAAVLGRQRLGGRKEVVMLPAAGGFFAYEPILKALQATHPLPLEKLKELPSSDIARLQRVAVAMPGNIPLDLLCRASSLDISQTRALIACLTQELAVVQGPPGTGEVDAQYVCMTLMQLLLSNTRGPASNTFNQPQADQPSSTIPLSQRPQIGPILVLCYTNHALDAFLEGLVDAGVDEGIIRVGGRSKSAKLERFNLRNQEDSRARGVEVARAAFLQEVTPQGGGGFQKVSSRSKRRKAQVLGTAEDEDGWVWGADVLQDWLHSSPVSDWQREQWVSRALQDWQGQVSEGVKLLECAEDAEDGVSDGSEPDTAAAQPPASQHCMAVKGGDLHVDPGTENPFTALLLLGDEADEEELHKALAGHSFGQQQPQGPEQWLKSSSSSFGRWMLHSADAPEEVQAEQLERHVDQLLQANDVSSMSRAERQRLYRHWLEAKATDWGTEINSLVVELEEEQAHLAQYYDRASLQVIIVEEAAEVLEAHILTSLTSATEHLILIGDHLQLPPKVETYDLQQESGRGHDLNVSLFERLVRQGNVQHVMLEEQRRMLPAISELIRGPLYPAMRDHPRVHAYPPVRGLVQPLFFWDHDHKEGGQDESKSKYNSYEVDACLGLARYLLQQGFAEEGDITILTPYVGQLLKLRQAVESVAEMRVVMSDKDLDDLEKVTGAVDDAALPSSTGGAQPEGGLFGAPDLPLGTAASCPGGAVGRSDVSTTPAANVLINTAIKVTTLKQSIRLATIDNFQGEEARVVIVSLVRNAKQEGGSIGFLAINNRINVLLSRAKEGMILIGSTGALLNAAEKAAASGRPCMWWAAWRQRELWGHHCRRCHADDLMHTEAKCLKPCSRLCSRGRHACQRLCHEPCKTCNAVEELVELPCGHTATNVPCHKYCVHPACKAQTPERVRNQVVDVITFKTFNDLTADDVSTDPLLLLPCEHLYTTSTLDGHMAMGEAYAAGDCGTSSSANALQDWLLPLSRSDYVPPKGCPDCRQVVVGLKRYNRVVLHSQLGLMQRKHAEAIRVQSGRIHRHLSQLQEQALSTSAGLGDAAARVEHLLQQRNKGSVVQGLVHELENTRRGAYNLGLGLLRLIAEARHTPKHRVAEAHKAALLAAVQQRNLTPLEGQARWEALQYFSQNHPDQQLTFDLMQGHARTLQLWLQLTSQQVEVLSEGLTQVGNCIMGLKTRFQGEIRPSATHQIRWLKQQHLDLKMQRQQLLEAAEGRLMEQQEVLQMRHSDIETIQELLIKLPDVAAQLANDGLDAAEVAVVLAAVMQGEGGWQRDLQSFMQGHLYQCPNGHVFVIGDYGGAMQLGRCAHCGARIGGTSHQLDTTNSRASQELVHAVASAAGQHQR